ncbi:MAG: O-antigen ligase family protein [Phycisphaerales bacterium]
MSKAAATLHSVGGVLLAIALVRLTSATSELPYWETDPAIQFVPETTITPAMSLSLDAVTWLACGLTFACMAVLKRRVSVWTVLAAMVGGAVVLGHGFAWWGHPNTQDLVRGSLWASSMIGAVTLAHLASDRVFRRLCFACLAGVAVYLSAKGAFQVLVEHPRYLQHFEQNKEQVLTAQGMAPGSPQALIYERRVRQPEATGWGGLSNSFGTVVAVGALAWLALTLGARKVVDKERTGLLGVIAVAGLVSLAGLWFSQSRAAMALAVLVAVVIPLARRLPAAVGRVSIMGLCALALLGVIAQGLLGPDIGDLSIYFRAQYWQGAMGVFADNPVFGVGAGSFKDAFLLHRPSTCPEEVDSPHSVFIDWLAALGLFALPWIGITLAALRRTGKRLVAPAEDQSESETPKKANRLALVAIVLFVFAWGAWLEWPTLLPDELFVRAIACGLWIFASLVYFGLAPKLTMRFDALLWALMAGLVAVHSMIEMTAVMPTTVMWGVGVVFVAGRVAHERFELWQRSSMLAVVPAVAVSVVLMLWGAQRAYAYELLLQRSASQVARGTEQFDTLGRQPLATFIADAKESEHTLEAAFRTMQDERVLQALASLRMRIASALFEVRNDTEAREAMANAVSTLGIAKEFGLESSTLEAFFGSLLQSQGRLQEALDAWSHAAALDPWGLEPARALYRLHRELGQTEEARRAAIRLLEVDDAKFLDPLRGLSEGERAEVEAFLQGAAPEAR